MVNVYVNALIITFIVIYVIGFIFLIGQVARHPLHRLPIAPLAPPPKPEKPNWIENLPPDVTVIQDYTNDGKFYVEKKAKKCVAGTFIGRTKRPAPPQFPEERIIKQ